MSNYPFVELHVAYPGHPEVKLVIGIDEFWCLETVRGVADQFYKRRDGIGTARQEQIFHLPAVEKIWEVWERVDDRRVRRYVAVHEGELHRLTRAAVNAFFNRKLSLGEAVASCRNMPIGPDYDVIAEEAVNG